MSKNVVHITSSDILHSTVQKNKEVIYKLDIYISTSSINIKKSHFKLIILTHKK